MHEKLEEEEAAALSLCTVIIIIMSYLRKDTYRVFYTFVQESEAIEITIYFNGLSHRL